jgi:predicted flap endonuclease-1-like 5' DNA nuclease
MPLWIWILVSLVVIAIGVIWTLREEEALASALPRPATIPEPVAGKPDDLKMVKGIGPKISGELNERGIFTFEQLAATDPAYLEELMNQLKWSEINHPDTWPEQARLLAEEKRRKHST